MKIKIAAVGRIRDKYLSGTTAEYLKRLSGYCPISIEETEELKAPQGLRAADENIITEKADFILSFSKMTFPHQLFRIMP